MAYRYIVFLDKPSAAFLPSHPQDEMDKVFDFLRADIFGVLVIQLRFLITRFTYELEAKDEITPSLLGCNNVLWL